MVKRILTLILLLLINTSLYAIDLNESTTIINEASEATQVLQNEFDTLINEVVRPIEEKVINKAVFELNETIKIDSSIDIKELNTTHKSSCKEENLSVIVNGLVITLDANNSIADNGCTDANLGTSVEGLMIFKTRIKPYCKMNGEAFAKQYMQEDWDDIYHDKEFKMEILKACPHMEQRYRDKWTPHLYQFTLEYASDSDAIPEC